MSRLTKQFKVKDGISPEAFIKRLNQNVAKMFVENNADPSRYTWSHEVGWLNEDFLKPKHTVRITATKIT